jgi:hypothetical protein
MSILRLLIPFFLLASLSGKAQLNVEAHALRGFLLPHRQNMLHLPQGPSNGLELRFTKQPSKNKAWSQLYQNPNLGLTIRGFDLANHTILGYGLAVGGIISSPVVTQNRFKWNLEMAAGLGFVSKPFDYKGNYQNIAIGSYVNAYIMLGQKFSYDLSDALELSTTLSFNHLSNAAYSLPNLGLNYSMVSLGIKTKLPPRPSQVPISDTLSRINGYWDISASFGVKETFIPRNKKFATYNVSFQKAMGVSKKSSIAPGIDLFYNSALKPAREVLGDSASGIQILQAGVRVAYQLHIDRLAVSLTQGIYLIDSYKKDGFLYHRAGLRYYLNQHWGMNLSLKTHFFKADFFELGAAYKF